MHLVECPWVVHHTLKRRGVNWLRICISGVQFIDSGDGGVVVQNGSESSLIIEPKEKQDQDSVLLQLKEDVHKQKIMVSAKGGDGVLSYQGKLCVPKVDDLRYGIMAEAHNSKYSII